MIGTDGPRRPLYKSGGHESMDNYRPISILPVMLKIMEKAVNVQLQQYLQRFDLLSPYNITPRP